MRKVGADRRGAAGGGVGGNDGDERRGACGDGRAWARVDSTGFLVEGDRRTDEGGVRVAAGARGMSSMCTREMNRSVIKNRVR